MPASQVAKKFKAGKLHSGSKQGPIVTNPAQAKAIQISEARSEGYDIPKKGKKVADHTKHGHPPHEVKGHHKIAKPGKQVSGGPGKIKDGHNSAMYDQRVTHDGLHAAGHTKRHTFHGIRHKDHHSKLSEG